MARALRILMVLRAPVGGLFRHVLDLSEGLAARGHQIGIVAADTGDAQTEGKLDGVAPHARLGIHRLALPRLLGPGDLLTPVALGRLARRLDVDVLHGHGAKGGLAARLARRPGGAPLALYTPHGGVLHYAPGSPAGRLFRGIEKALLAASDAIVFESGFARDTFIASIAAPRCPTPVIHNGVRAAEFEPVPLSADAVDFAFVGELRQLKGVSTLLEALAGVTRPDGRPARLVIAGGGADRATFEARAMALGLDGRVRFVGVQPARQVFAQGAVVVVPSWAESLPYVVLEAAAAGRPVVGTRVGGMAEIFGPTAAALVPPKDVAALRAALQTTLAFPEQAAEAAAKRRAFVREGFSVERMTDAIEALYLELCARRAAARGAKAAQASQS